MADIVPAPPGTWQYWVQQQAAALGLPQTSGYRSPESNAAAGGSPTSYHMVGTPSQPGAIDIGGPAAQLRLLFDQIRQQFQGRINELYLNVPGGQSQDIRNNQSISSNPEAGNPQHLHIALGTTTGPNGGPPPAAGIPLANRGQMALAAAPVGGSEECWRQVCPPDIRGWIWDAMPHSPGAVRPVQTNCLCWSDVWMYGAALGLIVGGSWMVFLGSGRKG